MLNIVGCAMILRKLNSESYHCFTELMKICGYMAVESRSVQNSRTSSTSMSKRRMGIGATYHKQVQGMECNFKWNELEKMSRIYADWIEDIPLVHGSSSKAEC